MVQQEVLDILAGLPLVREMPSETQEKMGTIFLEISETVVLEDGEPLMREGDLGAGAGFVLIQGGVVVEKEGSPSIDLPAPVLLGEMQQFNPQSLRTASVRAKGDAVALTFPWQEFYSQAKERLEPREQAMLIDSIERTIWERFDRETLIDLALFRALPDPLKLRVCLILQWLVKDVSLASGQTLFKEDDMCGATGYLLTQGSIQLTIPHQPVRTVAAPDILGVMPKFDPNLQWTATATAAEAVKVLKFSWLRYNAMLKERLSEEAQWQFGEAIAAASGQHFEH